MKHLSRHAFDDCDSLRTIIVPLGNDKFYRKALRIKDDNNDITVVGKVFSITPDTKNDTAANIKEAEAKKTVKAKPRAIVTKSNPVVAKPKTETAKPKVEVEKPKAEVAQPKADMLL